MSTQVKRPTIPAGNDFTLLIHLDKFNDGQYEEFDLHTATDLHVYLTCAVHNTEIDLDYTITSSNCLSCDVDYRLLHASTSYGVVVEGYTQDEKHFRWTMMPREGILVVPNTSGMDPNEDTQIIDLQGRVGWGISTSVHADWAEEDPTATSYIENKPDLSEYATETELQNYQETLVSGENIKTINNQSILGEGNITIEAATQVQSDWDEADNTSPAYIQNKPDLSNYVQSSELATVATSGNYSDLNGTPTIPAAPVQSNWNESDTTSLAYIQNKPTIPAAQVQANWNESDNTSLAYIQNKPTINTPGFAQYTNNNKTGLINTLSQYYNTNIGTCAVIEGDGDNDDKIEASGDYSHAEGRCNIASGVHSHAEGEYNTANGANSHAEGSYSTANGYHSHSEGFNTTADDTGSHSEGMYTQASGEASHAEGESTTASGDYSHAEGHQSIASNLTAHAEGYYTEASGIYGSHSEGYMTIASGETSHAEGESTIASGNHSHTEGAFTEAKNYVEHASGLFNTSLEAGTGVAFGSYAYTLFTVGNGQQNATHNALDIRQNGDIYIADTSQIDNTSYFFYNAPMIKLQDALSSGGGTQVQSDWTENDPTSMAYIQNKPTIQQPGFTQYTKNNKTGLINTLSQYYNTNIGTNAIIEGSGNGAVDLIEASGDYSHAEGNSTKAKGNMAHAEGFFTNATGAISHAEGNYTTASEARSHAEGNNTTASGVNSHAEGNYTTASNISEHAEGQCNISSKANNTFGDAGNTLSSIGNGTSTNNKHNAFEVRQNGDIYIADTSQIDNTSYFFYNAPMIKLQDALSGGGSTQVQSDWTENDPTSMAYILNKPTITTPDPSTGNAGQVLATNGTNYYFRNETEAMLISTSSGSTQTKRMSSSNIASLSMLQNNYFTVIISTDNTYVGEIKLRLYTDNTDTTGHTIYINGAISSSTNYTLPKGSYTVYYDGTYYYFDTTGQIPFVPKSSTYNMKIEVVNAMPLSPNLNTLYIVI